MELELTGRAAPLAFVQPGHLECLTTPSLTITELNAALLPRLVGQKDEAARVDTRMASCCRQLPRATFFRNCSFEFFGVASDLAGLERYPISVRLRLSVMTSKKRNTADRRRVRAASKKETFIAERYEALSVERVILKIVSPSISRITPHVAMLPRLQLPRLKTRR